MGNGFLASLKVHLRFCQDGQFQATGQLRRTGGVRTQRLRRIRTTGAREQLGTNGKPGPSLDWRRNGCNRSSSLALFETRMSIFCKPVANRLWMIAMLLLSAHFTLAQDVADIIRQSAEANNRDWAAAPEFDNSERDRTKDGDKTYAVTMVEGSPYERLLAVNGQDLSPAKQQEEQKKYEDAVAKRQHESPDKRSERIVKYQAERKRDHTMLEQMTTAFDFHLVGERMLSGHKVYVLKATPRKGYKPPDRDSQVLTGMEGTLWIDQKTFQWVKVEAHVTHPVRILGFMAEVEPGTLFEVEKRPVTSDIWLASHYSMKSNAKVMLLIPRKGAEDDTFFDYHRAGSPADKQIH
jgi:hypothetical protein